MRLERKVALVTGGAGGIGSATCSRLAAEGARVAVCDLGLEAARELAADLGGLGLELDVRSDESIAAAVAATERELGPIDVLVNNAGIGGELFFGQTPPEVWDNMLAVNLRGVLAVTHAVLPGMRERGSGAIVNVASEAGRVGSQLAVVYSATKAGVIGFTKALAKESARVRTSGPSASCGITSARTKLVTSSRRRPVRASISTRRTLSSVGIVSGSFWKPSRGPTSRMLTRSSLMATSCRGRR